jgi:hypothetical protein
VKHLAAKALEFVTLWFVYFIFMAILGVLTIYLLSPVILFVRTGEFQLVSSIQLLTKAGSGAVAGSFALAVVMFLWGHLKRKCVGGKS